MALAEITRQLTKNIFSSWSAYTVRMVIAFFFVPYITSVFGDARYGVWVIIFQTINYFFLLDVGLSSALTRFVSRHLSQDDYPTINRILNSANLAYLLLGTLVIGGVYLFVTFFFGYFKISDPGLIEEGRSALLILGLYMGFSFYLLPFGNTLGSFQRYDLANLLNIVEESVRVVLMVMLLRAGYGLVALALVILTMSVLKHLAGMIVLKRLHPRTSMRLSLTDKQSLQRLLGYSRISFGITIGWMVIFNSDSFLLGMITSSAAAGIYNPGAQLMHHLRNVVNAVGTPLIPAVSHLEAAGDMEGIRRIYLKALKYVSFFSFVLTVGVVVFAPAFVRLWLPAEFAPTSLVMVILALSSAVFLPQIIGNSILFGVDKHRYILQVLVGEVIIKIGLSIILVPRYGITGMALAAAVPQLLLYTTAYPYLLSKAISIRPARILSTSLGSGLVAVMVCYPIALLAERFVPPLTWGTFFGDIALVLLAALVAFYFVLEESDRNRVKKLPIFTAR